MNKEHAYAYEAGYRDGSINYELEHCPACKNVADLQEALAENAKLRNEVDNLLDFEHLTSVAVAYAGCDECGEYKQTMLRLFADNAKLRELARGLHMAYVETLNECESLNEELIWECSGHIDADIAKSRTRFEANRHRFDSALRELGIEEE